MALKSRNVVLHSHEPVQNFGVRIVVPGGWLYVCVRAEIYTSVFVADSSIEVFGSQEDLDAHEQYWAKRDDQLQGGEF